MVAGLYSFFRPSTRVDCTAALCTSSARPVSRPDQASLRAGNILLKSARNLCERAECHSSPLARQWGVTKLRSFGICGVVLTSQSLLGCTPDSASCYHKFAVICRLGHLWARLCWFRLEMCTAEAGGSWTSFLFLLMVDTLPVIQHSQREHQSSSDYLSWPPLVYQDAWA
jgi:hypothetical protein